MILRFCFEITQRTGKQITAADVMENDTPLAQSQLLDKRGVRDQEMSQSGNIPESAWIDEHRVSKEDNTILDDTAISAIEGCLRNLGFSWKEDLEAAYEPHEGVDMFLSSNTRSSSCNIRWAFEIKEERMSMERIVDSLKQCLERHATLRTVVVPLEKHVYPFRSVHVVLRSNPSASTRPPLTQQSTTVPLPSAKTRDMAG